MTPVALLTKDASLDDLSTSDYADIWQELRQNHSLRNVIEIMQSALSPARWQQYEKGECQLTRQMRNDLRRPFAHLPQLPMTVAEATAQASPDAAVWMVGDGVMEHVIMVGGDPVTLHVNGTVKAERQDVTKDATSPQVARKKYIRPCVPLEYAERLAALESVSWLDVIEAGLAEFEA